MGVLTYDIVARIKNESLAVASLSDFVLGAGTNLHDTEFLKFSASISPYCIDPLNGTVVLVELPSGTDLVGAPFIYELQYSAALRIHTVPIDEFCALANESPSSARPVLLHSTGRCGSTLLARALGGVPNVATFSEPDVFTQLASTGTLSDAARPQFEALYAASVRFLLRHQVGAAIFKPRAIVSEHARYLASALPAAVNIFLYRDAVAVAASYARLLGRPLSNWQLSDRQRHAWSKFAPLVSHLDGAVDGYDLMAALWAGPVLRYIELHPSGIWRGSVGYAEMLDRPTDVANAILLDPTSPSQPVWLSPASFGQHSQADSHLAPNLTITDSDLEEDLASSYFVSRISRSLLRIDKRLHPDMTLPGRLLA